MKNIADFVDAGIAAVASVAFGWLALWRVGMAIQHYRSSLNVVDDPSMREVFEVSAFFELGLAVLFILHAVVAAYLMRGRIRFEGVVFTAIGILVGVLIAGRFLQLPLLSIPGLLYASVFLAGVVASLIVRAPWASWYLGALVGSSLASHCAVPTIDSIDVLAVVVPSTFFALIGVAFSMQLRQRGLFS